MKIQKPKPATPLSSDPKQNPDQPDFTQDIQQTDLTLLQRALAEPDAVRLTPDVMNRLQRTYGNHSLNQLLSKKHEAVPSIYTESSHTAIQRTIYKTFRGKRTDFSNSKTTAEAVLAHIKQYKDHDSNFEAFAAIEKLLTVEAIQQEIDARSYLSDTTDRTIPEVSPLIFKSLHTQILWTQGANSQEIVPGLKVKIFNAAARVAPTNIVPDQTTDKLDFHAPQINIDASVGIEITNAQLAAEWQVGLTQTVIGVKRYFEALADMPPSIAKRESATTILNTPANDRNPGMNAPWYSVTSYSGLQMGLQQANVSLLDKPGEEFTQSGATFRIREREGNDAYKTWLILYNTKTGEAKFLREWAWTVDYQNKTGIVTVVDDANGRAVNGTPGDAVITGGRAKDALTHTPNSVNRINPQYYAFQSAVLRLSNALDGTDESKMIKYQNLLQETFKALDRDEQTEQEALKRRLVQQFWNKTDRKPV